VRGVVDQHVDPAELAERPVDQGGHLVDVREVRGQRDAARVLLRDLGEQLAAPADDPDGGARGGERLGEAAAQPGGGAGQQYRAPLEGEEIGRHGRAPRAGDWRSPCLSCKR
jgi:hypothetical protein